MFVFRFLLIVLKGNVLGGGNFTDGQFLLHKTAKTETSIIISQTFFKCDPYDFSAPFGCAKLV